MLPYKGLNFRKSGALEFTEPKLSCLYGDLPGSFGLRISRWTVRVASDNCVTRKRSGLSTKGEADVVFKGLIAATAAIALSATPALAQVNAAAPLAVAPATETVEEGSEMFGNGGFIIPLVAVALVVLGVLVLIDNDDDDLPTSP